MDDVSFSAELSAMRDKRESLKDKMKKRRLQIGSILAQQQINKVIKAINTLITSGFIVLNIFSHFR